MKNEITQREKRLIALLLSTAIETQPFARKAEWLTEDEDIFDIQMGTHNDWWLRTDRDTGNLYIQSRYDTHIPEKAWGLMNLADEIREITGIEIGLPWSREEVRICLQKIKKYDHITNQH